MSTIHYFPFNRSASYADTQRIVDLSAPRVVGRLLEIERNRTLEEGIAEVVSQYHRRQVARRDARAHVRRLLAETREFRKRHIKAYAKFGPNIVREYELAFMASAMDCFEAYHSRNRV
jgi:hypothetical protein